MRTFTFRRARGREGQALAEMAFLLPVLLILVFGIIEISSAWRTFSVLTNATREGARSAVVPDATAERVKQRVEETMISGRLVWSDDMLTMECINAQTGAVIVADGVCTGMGRTGSVARIRVDYPYTFGFLAPLARWACRGDCDDAFGAINIANTSTMRNE